MAPPPVSSTARPAASKTTVAFSNCTGLFSASNRLARAPARLRRASRLCSRRLGGPAAPSRRCASQGPRRIRFPGAGRPAEFRSLSRRFCPQAKRRDPREVFTTVALRGVVLLVAVEVVLLRATGADLHPHRQRSRPPDLPGRQLPKRDAAGCARPQRLLAAGRQCSGRRARGERPHARPAGFPGRRPTSSPAITPRNRRPLHSATERRERWIAIMGQWCCMSPLLGLRLSRGAGSCPPGIS